MSGSVPPEIPSATDRIFSVDESGQREFRFDEAVAQVFPDMLRRSIPGYATLLHLIGVLAGRVVTHGTTVYDLGCSLGAVSLSIRHALGLRDCRIVAIDNSEAMVTRCREVLNADSGACPVEVRIGDISQMTFEPTSLVVLNFTLQFLPVIERPVLLKRIADSLVPGGVLVLSEKTATSSDGGDALYAALHDDFRHSNGYSRLEMSRKREALEKVLVPQSVGSHTAMLEQAGLEPLEWFRCLHFVSWIATKGAK